MATIERWWYAPITNKLNSFRRVKVIEARTTPEGKIRFKVRKSFRNMEDAKNWVEGHLTPNPSFVIRGKITSRRRRAKLQDFISRDPYLYREEERIKAFTSED